MGWDGEGMGLGAGGNGADALLCPQEIRKVVQALEQTAREILTLLQGVHQGGGFQHSECPPHPPHPLLPLPQAALCPPGEPSGRGRGPGCPWVQGEAPRLSASGVVLQRLVAGISAWLSAFSYFHFFFSF